MLQHPPCRSLQVYIDFISNDDLYVNVSDHTVKNYGSVSVSRMETNLYPRLLNQTKLQILGGVGIGG